METTKYTIEIRQEGRRKVFDLYNEAGILLWKGLSLAGMNDILAQLTED